MPKLQLGGGGQGSDPESWSTSESAGLETYDYAENVERRLAELGVTRHDPPKVMKAHEGVLGVKAGQYFDGRLPTVIKDLTLDQLSALNSLYSNWHSYLRYQLTVAAARMSEAKRQADFLWSLIRQQRRMDPSTGKKRDPQTMSDVTTTDFRWVTADARYAQEKLLYDFLDAFVEMAKQDMKVISREVTIQENKLLQKGFGRGSMGSRFRSGGHDDGEGSETQESRVPNKVKRRVIQR